MPYTSPIAYKGVKKYRVFRLSTSQDLYVFHMTGPAAPMGLAGLLVTIKSKLVGYRFEISDFLCFTNTSAPLTATLGLKAYNEAGSNEYSLSQLNINNFFLQFGPPKFRVPVGYGDNLDVTFDGDALASGTDEVYLQFIVTKIYEAGIGV